MIFLYPFATEATNRRSIFRLKNIAEYLPGGINDRSTRPIHESDDEAKGRVVSQGQFHRDRRFLRAQQHVENRWI